MSHEQPAPDPGPTGFRSEDWLAVWLGALVIVLVLAGLPLRTPSLKWAAAADLSPLITANLGRFLTTGVAVLVLSAAGIAMMGGRLGRFVAGFPVVYLLAVSAMLIAGNAGVVAWGFEYVIWALLLGLVIGNLIGVPAWLGEAVRTEYYIKTGLVILGAGILFFEILQAGALGLVQAVAVVLVVWYACFFLARRLGVDDEFAVILSSAVAICGVSAAIAACGAIQGDRRKLSYVTSLGSCSSSPCR